MNKLIQNLREEMNLETTYSSLFEQIKLLSEAIITRSNYNNVEYTKYNLYDLIKHLQKLSNNEDTHTLISHIYSSIADLQRDTGNITSKFGALFNYKSALNHSFKVLNYLAICNLYISVGACYEMKNSYKISKLYYSEAIDCSRYVKNNEFLLSNALTRIGCILTKENKLDMAKRYIEKSIEVRKQHLLNSDISYILSKKAIIHLKDNKQDFAYSIVDSLLHQEKNLSELFKTQLLVLGTDILISSNEINQALNFGVKAENYATKNNFRHQKKALYKLF